MNVFMPKMQILWFMRAYLDDLLATPESLKYVNCLTVLSRCQRLFEIIPGLDYDPLPSAPVEASPLTATGTATSTTGKEMEGPVPGTNPTPTPAPASTSSSAVAGNGLEQAPAENAPRADRPLILIPKNTSKFVNPRWTMVAIGLFGAILVPNLVKEYREAIVKYARDVIPDNPSKELQYLLTSPVMPRDAPSKDELKGNDAFSYQRYST